MFKVKLNDQEIELDKPTSLLELAKPDEKKYVGAKVNNRIRELTFVVNRDCEIEFLDLCNTEASRIYEASLRYLMVMAIERTFPGTLVEFNYSISRSVMCQFLNFNRRIDNTVVKLIQEEMNKLIEMDLPIKRLTLSISDATAYYEKKGYQKKMDILKYRTEKTVNLYECDDYINYMFGYMVPSTGYLSKYKLRVYYPGIMLQYPRADYNGLIPPFEDSPSLSSTLFKAAKWSKICDASYIADMNKIVENNQEIDFINMCETKHTNMLAELGEKISADKNIRLVAIAGPSSSGKTTFSMRLQIELKTRGLHPVMISIDDYYLSRDEAPKDEFGEPDLEHIEALDIDLFNHDMLALVSGEEVTLPKFNFKTGKREKGKTIKVLDGEPIIIEGIHALNETLTSLIPRHQKFKIYIAPQIQLHIDSHNPINMTDIRLLRRLVRDKNYRNTDPRQTFAMWKSVRRGEFRWIYPTQEEADYVYNSELTYELCVLKKYALPMLESIGRDDEYFIQANKLIKFLKYFKDIDDTWVPCNSLLREFIGKSCFHV